MVDAFERIGEELHYQQLSNGLTVYLVPKKGFHKTYACLTVRYGGADRSFVYGGRKYDTPMGIAHFLEHKMFDMPYGSALTRLSSNGASPNAYTASDETAYHFECTDKFKENLDTLLEFVFTPYFTDESVSKEQGIISQEILMTLDDPQHALYRNFMKSVYSSHPVRDPVIGTLESIMQIDASTLELCHKLFYTPQNCVLTVVGDVEMQDILESCEKHVPDSAGLLPARDYGPRESLVPSRTLIKDQMEVSMPLFLFGCGVKAAGRGESVLRQICTASYATEIICGRMSRLYNALYSDGLIDKQFSAGLDMSADVSTIVFSGRSNDPEKVMLAVLAETETVISRGVSGEELSLLRRYLTGESLSGLNYFSLIARQVADGHFYGYSPFGKFEILDSISADEIISFISENINKNRTALSVIAPTSSAKGGVQ